ncbi:MAG: proteasome activator [Microthrixaceae bacterium]|jgi:hypothetical protein
MSDPTAADPSATDPSATGSSATGSSTREVLAPDDVLTAAGADGEADLEIGSPAKIIRIGAMVKQLLEEVRNTSLDDASRDQLRTIYESSIEQLKSALSPDLAAELEHLSFVFSDDTPPTDAELRLAEAQLVGWLEGLFHGIQATLVAQQMAAQQQLQGMRAQIPERAGPPEGPGYI